MNTTKDTQSIEEEILIKSGSAIGLENEKNSQKTKKMYSEDKEKITKTIQMLLKNNVSEDTKENQIEQYEPQDNFLQKELLGSTNILNESVTLLHGQTKKLLIKENPEIKQASDWDIGQARLNMETVAKLIQTKVNFIKALRK